MAKKQTRRPSSKKSTPKTNLVAFYQNKMEAEWGPYDLKHALDERPQDIVVVDTRSPEAFAEEHILGAVNIPTDQLERRLSELPKNREIVPYCWTVVCHLATHAALILAKKGYRVHELAGGIGSWKDYEMPVESDKRQTASVR